MPILSNAQVATLQKVLAVTNNVLPRLEMLEALANINVAMKARVQELRSQREYLAQLATAALEIERQVGTTVNIPAVKMSSGIEWQPPPKSYTPPEPQPLPPEIYQGPTTQPGYGVPQYPISHGTANRIFVRAALQLDPGEEEMWRQRGFRLEVENGNQWYAVKM